MADLKGHVILTHAAIEALPLWQREMLAAPFYALENEYCMYGDDYFGRKEELGQYVELPDGRLPMDPWELRLFRKDAPGEDYFICGYYDLMRTSFTYFAAKCIERLKAGDLEGFAKFAGTVAHVIEDCGCPPHSVGTTMGTDMKMIKMLFPPDDRKTMALQYHSVLEGQYEPFNLSASPGLIGTSAEEIAFNIFERFTDMLENSISRIIPMLDAFYKNDIALLRKQLTESGEFSSSVLSDFLYSVICVGASRFESSELEQLNSAYLSEYTPEIRTGWMPYPYAYPEMRKSPYCLNSNFEPVDLSLKINGKERFYENGFGLGVPFKADYILPSGIYKTFKSEVGIHSRLGARSGIAFKVLGDGAELAAAECSDSSSSSVLSIDISNIKRLTLKLESTNSECAWPDNTHAVWGNPRLIKQ
ncbi:MAG: hypothetical protein A2020_04175 [Lentisphaerae bacterium GWF2_45_14]|nr:MAG: hypothetical protein A2020_04175 [Lentisphaerae bacterium GWF2_45_14]